MPHSKRADRVLRSAAHHGNASLLRAALARGADPNARRATWHEHSPRTPLIRAVLAGHLECARILLERGARPDDTANFWQTSALMHAVRSGDMPMVELLLAHGAGLEVEDSCGRTALMFAVEDSNLAAVKTLLTAGANPAATTRWGSAGTSVLQVAERTLAERQRAVRGLAGSESKALTAALRRERDATMIHRLLEERIAVRAEASAAVA